MYKTYLINLSAILNYCSRFIHFHHIFKAQMVLLFYFCMVIKLSAKYFLLTSIGLFFFATLLKSQQRKIDISAINVDFETILHEICDKADMEFQLQCKRISKKQKFFINAKNITVREILNKCLEGSRLVYEIEGSKIIIRDDKSKRGWGEGEILTQTIKGTVRDIESKRTLPGATILILGTEPVQGTSSDRKGNYRINKVPLGRYTLKVSFIGYKDVIIPEVLVGSAKEVVLNVELNEVVQKIDQIIIEADKERPLNDMALVSARSFSVDETKRYAASFSDPARMALCYAGVATTHDFMNEIIVRGNSPQYLLWRIEGVEVPSPNHFTDGGVSGGAVSILSSNVIGRSDFLTGAFPADYGNALSGVFDISLRKGNNEKREIAVQAGTLGLDFSAEGPFNDDYTGSYLFNYRYSTLAFLSLIELSFLGGSAPSYQDLSFKLNLPTKKFGRFSVWGVGGVSYERNSGVTDSTDWSPNEITYSERWADYMMAVGVTHVINPTINSYLKTTVAMTKYGSSALLDTLLSDDVYENIVRKELFNTSLSLAISYNNKLSRRISLRAGMNLNYSFYSYLLDISSAYINKINSLDTNGETYLTNVYTQVKYKLSKHMIINAGMNFMYYDLNQYYSFEPRVGFQWEFAKKQSFALGYGIHSRHELPVLYFKKYSELGDSFTQLDFTKKLPSAHHFVASYSRRFNENFYMKFETYFQKIENYYVASQPEYTFSAADNYLDFSIPLKSSGLGRNYGIEFTLEKYFTKNYYFLVTSSLFKSEYQAMNKVWYSTIYDLGYIHNIVAGKEFRLGKGKNDVFGFNTRVNWTGGKRDTPILLQESVEADYTVYDEMKRNMLQYPAYFRIDLGLSYQLYRKKTAHFFSVDIQNIFNRKNIAYRYYNPSLQTLTIQTQAGVIPVFNYRLEF